MHKILESLDTQAIEEDVSTVLFGSYVNAKEFLVLLPINVPDPEVAIEHADGADFARMAFRI